MVSSIDEGMNVFYVYTDSTTASINPIACSLTVKKVEQAWMVTWMDIVGGRDQIRQVRKTESGFWSKWHKITCDDGTVYTFKFLSQAVYNDKVKQLVTPKPDFSSDDEVQAYFQRPHN